MTMNKPQVVELLYIGKITVILFECLKHRATMHCLIILNSCFNRSNAEDAIQILSGTVIGKQTVRLSWGRNLGNRQVSGNLNFKFLDCHWAYYFLLRPPNRVLPCQLNSVVFIYCITKHL